KCFITVSVGMVRAIRCHRQNMKTSIINGSEVSRLSVAIHNPGFFRVKLYAVPHFQVEGMDVNLSLVSQMPKAKS
ncbi:hypothetical protein, partial [Scandinavium sp. UTDF21-P1B]|uniref:hypothetical protein n=1 Tax=Scandinavium sp. UTDF21-P1B TaxID=3446379 RepID=UPI003F53D565